MKSSTDGAQWPRATSDCPRRVRRLEQDGIILGYHARIDPAAIGRGFGVHVDFELADQVQTTIERFEAALIAYDEVVEARRTFGAPDYRALVAVADLAAYEHFMTQHLTALPGLSKMQSRFTMKTIKGNVPTPPRSTDWSVRTVRSHRHHPSE